MINGSTWYHQKEFVKMFQIIFYSLWVCIPLLKIFQMEQCSWVHAENES